MTHKLAHVEDAVIADMMIVIEAGGGQSAFAHGLVSGAMMADILTLIVTQRHFSDGELAALGVPPFKRLFPESTEHYSWMDAPDLTPEDGQVLLKACAQKLMTYYGLLAAEQTGTVH